MTNRIEVVVNSESPSKIITNLQYKPKKIDFGFFVGKLFFYIFGIIIGLFIFILAFLIGFLSSVPILFYRGLLLIPVVALAHMLVLVAALLWLRRQPYRFHLAAANVATIVALGAMLNLTFFILLPVNLDRSISVFLLSWMNENAAAEGRTKTQIEQAFQQIYITQYRAIDRRIVEQLASGNIVETPEGYRLTDRGQAFVATARFVGDVFAVDPRFLRTEAGAVAAYAQDPQ